MPNIYCRLPIIYNMEHIESKVKCYRRKYKRKGKEYTTTQYVINLRKEGVESQGFKCDEDVIITHKSTFESLIDMKKSYEADLKEKESLQKNLSELQVEFNKLKNEYKHVKALLDKKEREVNHLENEVRRLQNMGLFEIILNKLRKKKAIEGEVEGEVK